MNRRVTIPLLLTLAWALPLRAQSSAEINAGLEFNFASPGARSLGVGGAFVGIADDAMASYTNPAGLLNISRPQLALELRGWSFTNTFTDSGRASGKLTNLGTDTFAGLRDGQLTRRVANLSYASIVYPQRRWAVALYRQELARFRASAQTAGAFFEAVDPITHERFASRFFAARGGLDLRVISYGASAAASVNDHLIFGATLAYQSFQLDSTTVRFFTDEKGPASYTDPVNLQEQHGTDDRLALNAGMLWQIDSRVTLGAVYRQGSSFRLKVWSAAPGETEIDKKPAQFHIPDVAAIGVAIRPHEDGRTIVSIDVDRIGYSKLTRGFVPLVGEPDLYRVDDGTEVHLGYERFLAPGEQHLLRSKYPLVVRLGAWREPDHRLRYTDPLNPQALLFRRGKAEYHVSGGLGIAVGSTWEGDAAYDYSRRQRILSFSFGRSF